MISFLPTNDQKLMIESVGQLARTSIRPKFRQTEAARGLAGELRKAGSELGLGLGRLAAHHGLDRVMARGALVPGHAIGQRGRGGEGGEHEDRGAEQSGHVLLS
jgi:hypothetical protein